MRRFNILVGVIAIFGDNLLLLQRSSSEEFLPGYWGPPCGKVDFGEELENAVHRELFEEAGLRIREFRRMVGHSMFMSKQDGEDLHNLQINFLVEVAAPEPVTLDKSADAYKWITFRECKTAGLSDYALATIRQAFDC
jgi:ADP-ribose pyrophosphatase YjhB (NUDIX family)